MVVKLPGARPFPDWDYGSLIASLAYHYKSSIKYHSLDGRNFFSMSKQSIFYLSLSKLRSLDFLVINDKIGGINLNVNRTRLFCLTAL